MSDPQLPQPIYPPANGGPGGGTGGGWGAPAGPPPGAPVGPPSGGYPPAGPPPGGGYGAPGPSGFPTAPGSPKGSGPSRNQIIAIIAVVAIVGGLIAGVLASQDDDGDKKASAQTDGPGTDTGTGTGTGGGGGTGTGASAAEVAQMQFAGASSGTVDCVATGLDADDAMLAELVGDTDGAVIDDPGTAARYGELVAGCSNPQELAGLLQATLTQSGMESYTAQCIATNTQGFGTTQWAEFLGSSVQAAEQAYLEGLLTDLASTC